MLEAVKCLLAFSFFAPFITFLCIAITAANLIPDGNKGDLMKLLLEHRKSADTSTFSLIILVGISENW